MGELAHRDVILERVAAGRKVLAEIETLEDAIQVADMGEAIRYAAKVAGASIEIQNEAAALRIEAQRRAGSLLQEQEKHPPKVSHEATPTAPPKLSDLGVSRSQSSRWQKLASVPEEEWSEYRDTCQKRGEEITTNRLMRRQRHAAARKQNEAKEKEARGKITGEPLELAVADLADWAPTEPLAAIITDPPYVGDSLPLYGKLRDFALRTLEPHGALVVMTWQAILPGVIAELDHPELHYRWCIAWRYDNNERTQDHARRVFDCWKPVLVYHLHGHEPDARVIYDEVSSPRPDKAHHEWGQNVDGFERLVNAFTDPGDVVCDPFLGAGTTGLAALAAGRQFVGCDIDSAAVEMTRERLV